MRKPQVLLREANAAYANGDFEAFTTALETAAELNPASLATRYNLACGYAKTGQPERGLAELRRLANLRVDFGMAEDADLESLRARGDFKALVDTLADAIDPILVSAAFFEGDELGLIPEGYRGRSSN